jgi:hypothetical protein
MARRAQLSGNLADEGLTTQRETPMSLMNPASDAFASANPHALAIILEASETKKIIAATDIFDISGIKLWARDQPVSAALQRKLLDRQLKKPLESCLVAQDGVTTLTLTRALQALLDGPSPLAPVLQPHGSTLMREAAQLPLHPVAQLMLTAGQAAHPASFDHAVQAMALCGALMAHSGAGTAELRLAMLCGLLHDLGALYVDPVHGEAESERELEFVSYQQLVVHPHVGQLLISQLTDYPAAVARAIAEHHERLDGSGYPHALTGDKMSPLGRLLAVVEAALAALGGGNDHLLHASVALRAVPGEFDLQWVGDISHAATQQLPLQPVMEAGDIQARLTALGDVLTAAENSAAALRKLAPQPPLKGAVELAAYLLSRLRAGWNESGMWNPDALSAADAAEVEALEDELYRRLRGIQRAALLRAGTLPPAEAKLLSELCDSLAMGSA